MGVTRTIEQIARGIEVLGITTLVSGLAIAVVRAANILIHSRSGEGAYRTVRTVFGQSILLGLEFLVAADIIRTIAVEPSLENVEAQERPDKHDQPQDTNVLKGWFDGDSSDDVCRNEKL